MTIEDQIAALQKGLEVGTQEVYKAFVEVDKRLKALESARHAERLDALEARTALHARQMNTVTVTKVPE